MLSALDTLSLPVFTQVMPGERSDDPLYLLAIVQVQKTLGCRGLLHVGDYKLAALATWVFVQSTQDSCLCPLVEIQLPPAELKTYLALIWIGACAPDDPGNELRRRSPSSGRRDPRQ